jgi:hypothetical protein
MEQILKSEIVAILNKIQRGSAPKLTDNDIVPYFVVVSDHKFDLVDSKDGSPIRDFETGTAHYINGNEGDTYNLKIICYDDFLHQFTYDDGIGHAHVSRLKKFIASWLQSPEADEQPALQHQYPSYTIMVFKHKVNIRALTSDRERCESLLFYTYSSILFVFTSLFPHFSHKKL